MASPSSAVIFRHVDELLCREVVERIQLLIRALQQFIVTSLIDVPVPLAVQEKMFTAIPVWTPLVTHVGVEGANMNCTGSSSRTMGASRSSPFCLRMLTRRRSWMSHWSRTRSVKVCGSFFKSASFCLVLRKLGMFQCLSGRSRRKKGSRFFRRSGR